MTTQAELDWEECQDDAALAEDREAAMQEYFTRDLDDEFRQAMESYEKWQMELPRPTAREWSDAEISALLPAPF